MLKKRMLITGSNGLLGQAIIETAQLDGTISLINGSTNKPNICTSLPDNQFHLSDVTDYNSVYELIGKVQPEVVLHTAAKTLVDPCELHPVSCRKVNVEGARNVALACKHFGIHMIHMSTDFVFDGTSGPYDEHAQPHPQSVYAHSKWESEQIVSSLLPNATIIRTALVYGWFPTMSRSNFMVWVINSLKEGRPIRVVCDQFRTPTYAFDLAAACTKAANDCIQGLFHVSGAEFYSVYEFALLIADVFRLDTSLIEPIETHLLNEAAKRPYITGFEIGKANRILQFSPTAIVDALQEINQKIQNQGLLETPIISPDFIGKASNA
jgi:dTDP-4-dehydrorhamnose reductase